MGGVERAGKRRLVAVSVALASLACFPAASHAATLALLGKSNLGGGGLNGQLATVGNTGVVASGILPARNFHTSFYDGTYTCLPTTVKVVDVSSPSHPTVRAQIPLDPGIVANDVAALHVHTAAFSGDLLAVALARCNSTAGNGGVAYYNITNPVSPVLLGRYQADANQPSSYRCGGPPTGTGPFACPSQDQVALVQRPDGKVLSLSTEPFSSPVQADPSRSADVRIVDVTNPSAPTEISSYPSAFPTDQRPLGYNGELMGYSNNGCRPFDGAEGVGIYPDGSKALVPYFDQGIFSVDLTNPFVPTTLGHYQYPRSDRAFEGNAAYADFAKVGARTLALLGEADWIAPNSSLRIDGPSSVAGSKFACEAMFTLFDPNDKAQVYRHPGSQVTGSIVYVGLGQPGTPYPDGVDPRGKIAFRDKNVVSSRQGPGGAVGSTATAVKRLQDDGAIGVILGGTSTTVPQAISADGNPTGITIPTFSVDTGDATALRDALCPVPATPPTTLVVECGPGGQPVSGAMVDSPGAWGALRVIDTTNPAAPTLRGVYQPPAAKVFPPPDLGVYSVHHAIARGSIGYVAAHANGLRVIDLTRATPTELASFVPPDTPDPTHEIPAKANVTGVDVAANGAVVVSDTNSGLYVVGLEPPVVSRFRLTNGRFAVGGRTSLSGRAAAKRHKKGTTVRHKKGTTVRHKKGTTVRHKKGTTVRHKKGTTFEYTLSEAATVRITIDELSAGRHAGKRCVAPTRRLRRGRKCTRAINRGTLTRTSHRGANSVAFSGRIGSRALTAGRYVATLVATDDVQKSSRLRTVSFTILAP